MISAEYTLKCDRCVSYLRFPFFPDAKTRKRAGWKRKRNRAGNMQDVCPICQAIESQADVQTRRGNRK